MSLFLFVFVFISNLKSSNLAIKSSKSRILSLKHFLSSQETNYLALKHCKKLLLKLQFRITNSSHCKIIALYFVEFFQ